MLKATLLSPKRLNRERLNRERLCLAVGFGTYAGSFNSEQVECPAIFRTFAPFVSFRLVVYFFVKAATCILNT